MQKADATDNCHTGRSTLNTTAVRRKRSPRSFSRRRTDAVASIDGIRRPNITLGWLEAGRFRIQAPERPRAVPEAICVIGGSEAGRGPVMETFESPGMRSGPDVRSRWRREKRNLAIARVSS